MFDDATANSADKNENPETLEPIDRNSHQLISAVDLRELFGGVTDMTISRWLKNETLNFPKPIWIATRRYWYEAEVIEWIGKRPRECGSGNEAT
jgi:predicted DNA-binding transcriptional regulator AlpA